MKIDGCTRGEYFGHYLHFNNCAKWSIFANTVTYIHVAYFTISYNILLIVMLLINFCANTILNGYPLPHPFISSCICPCIGNKFNAFVPAVYYLCIIHLPNFDAEIVMYFIWFFIQLDVSLKPSYNHSLTALSVTSEVTEVTMFGGVTKYSYTEEDIISETVLLHFGENTYCCINNTSQ